MYDINPMHDFFMCFGGRGIVINKQFTDMDQKLLHTLFKMEKSLNCTNVDVHVLGIVLLMSLMLHAHGFVNIVS